MCFLLQLNMAILFAEFEKAKVEQEKLEVIRAMEFQKGSIAHSIFQAPKSHRHKSRRRTTVKIR
jgi:hypothetical protein